MGISESSHQLCPHKYLPTSRYVRPTTAYRTDTSLPITFKALPPTLDHEEYALPSHGDLVWVCDCQFVPYDDTRLVTTVGAYTLASSRIHFPVNNNVRGLITKWRMTGGRTLSYDVIKETATSAQPAVHTHPGGEHICYIAIRFIKLLNLRTLRQRKRGKYDDSASYHYCSTSPDGQYLAAVEDFNAHFYLVTYRLQGQRLVTVKRSECDDLVRIRPENCGNEIYTEIIEAIWSPDSSSIAMTSSSGLLSVFQRDEHRIRLTVAKSEDILQSRIMNPVSVDFDKRYANARLLVTTSDNRLTTIDIDKGEINAVLLVDYGTVQCLKVGPDLNIYVCLEHSRILVIDPDLNGALRTLDTTIFGPEFDRESDSLRALRMSFSQLGERLALSYSDCTVRLVNIPIERTLQFFCRTVILETFPIASIPSLNLPDKLILFLLQIPESFTASFE